MSISSILIKPITPTILLAVTFVVMEVRSYGGSHAELWGPIISAVLLIWLCVNIQIRNNAIKRVTEVCQNIGSGDFESRVMLTNVKDKLVIDLGNAVNKIIDCSDAYVRESVAMFEHAAEEKFYRKILITGMTGTFSRGAVVLNSSLDKVRENMINKMSIAARKLEETLGGVINNLALSATNMIKTAQQMKDMSGETSQISGIVAAAAVEASSNVQTVASATEELAASSAEIARQIESVAKQSNIAAHDAEETRKLVQDLNALANSVGDVVNTIRGIADQTNLLALNATIEAARAGDAGKGFAVVADEVKKLANETGAKTSEIDQRVNRIQEAIRLSVDAMERVIGNINTINTATTTVAGAVEEQNAATAEIGRNVSEASSGTQQVTVSINDVQKKASDTGSAADNVYHAATGIQSQSSDLKSELAKFVENIKKAS